MSEISSQNDTNCAEKLDLIDSILSNIEKGLDEESNDQDEKGYFTKSNLTKLKENDQGIDSPKICLNKTVSKMNTVSLLSKSKSFNNLTCSTPKFTTIAVKKENELTENLYRNGFLNENLQINNQSAIKKSISSSDQIKGLYNKTASASLVQCESNFKMSPIIPTSLLVNRTVILEKCQASETPVNIENKVFLSEKSKQYMENLNRNLSFDENEKNETINEESKIDITVKETIDEDDELLLHVEKIESLQSKKNSSGSSSFINASNKRFEKKNCIQSKSLNHTDNEVAAYSTAKGISINIKEKTIHNLSSIIDLDKNLNNHFSSMPVQTNGVVTSGFTTSSGKKIDIKENTLRSVSSLLESDDIDNKKSNHFSSMPVQTNGVVTSGFTTSSGKKIDIKEEILSNKLNAYKNESYIENKMDSENLIYDKLCVTEQSFVSNTFKKKKSPPREIKQSNLNLPNILNKSVTSIESARLPTKTNCFKKVIPKMNVSASIASQKEIIDDKRFKKPQLIENQAKFNKYVDNDCSINGLDRTVDMSNTIQQSLNESLISIKNLFEEESKYLVQLNDIIKSNPASQSLNELHEISYLDMKDIEIKTKISNVRKNIENQALNEGNRIDEENLFQEHTFFVVRPIYDIAQMTCDPERLYSKICLDTNNKINLQNIQRISLSNNNIENDECTSSSEIYEMNRFESFMNLKRRLEEKKSMKLTPNERSKSGYLYIQKLKAKQERLRLNCLEFSNKVDSYVALNEEYEDYKMDILDFYSIGSIAKLGYVKTPDNGCLVSSKELKFGVNEFFDCFLDSDGVDANLVDFLWFKNHYRWIVWKLHSYDAKFKNFSSEKRALNPIGLALQLKYRYDIEIGSGKRSCIKKLIEKDDTPMNKLIVLFISKIFLENDKSSSSTNQISIELSDGWYPIKGILDSYLSSYVREKKLKIGQKLAIFSGDLIGCPKDGCLPLEAPEGLHLKLYINSTRKAKWYSKLGFSNPQRPLIVSIESIKPNSNIGAIDVIIERIYPLLFLEKKEDGSKIYRNQKQEESFCYAKQVENEKNNYQNTESQLNAFNNGGLEKTTNAKYAKRNVTQLLKIRVIDAKNFKNVKIKQSCLITIWQNAHEIRDKINEGHRIVLMNLNSTSYKSSFQDTNAANLNTSRQTCYIFKKMTRGSSRLDSYIDLHNEKILCSYSEIDLTGVFLTQSVNNYQNLIFLSTQLDSDNSIVCICFPKAAEFYGFKDLFKCSNVLACLNLKFNRKKELAKYPCLLATELSIFTQRVNGYKHLIDHFNSLYSIAGDQKGKSIIKDMQQMLDNELKLNENKAIQGSNFTKFKSVANISLQAETYNANYNKLDEIAKIAEQPLISLKNGLKNPGLSSKSNRLSLSVMEDKKQPVRSLKRTSDAAFETINFKSKKSAEEEDDENDEILFYDFLKNMDSKRIKKF